MFKYLLNYFTNNNAVSYQSVFNSKYYLNDPSTDKLVTEIKIPQLKTKLKFRVENFFPNEPIKDAIKNRAASCYVSVANTLNEIQELHPIYRWAATNNLLIRPNFQRGLNAYYNRNTLTFFQGVDPITKKSIFTCESSDIVVHELGHAILDCIKPELWDLQSLEAWAFHESFADITAIFSLLQKDIIIDRVLEETDHNLLLSNTASRIGEELGRAIFNSGGAREKRNPNFLRDATIEFKYIDPKNLPSDATDDKLSSECHSFGRVFLNAWYEILALCFKLEKDLGRPSKEALKIVSNSLYSCLIKATINASSNLYFLETIARNMIILSKADGNKYTDIMNSVFISKRIIKPKIKMLSNIKLKDLEKDNKVVNIENDSIVVVKKVKKIILSNVITSSLDASESDPIYNAEMTLPFDDFYHFDEKGELVDEISCDDNEILQSALMCALSIQSKKDLGEDKTWKIQENKLLRNLIF